MLIKLLIPRDNSNSPVFPSEQHFAVLASVLSSACIVEIFVVALFQLLLAKHLLTVRLPLFS